MVAVSCYTKSYALLIAGRAVAGLSGFSLGVAKAYIADVVDVANQAAFLARLGVIQICSILFGPLAAIGLMFLARAAGTTKESEWASVFFVGAGLGVCAYVIAALKLKESKSELKPCASILVRDKRTEDGSESSRSDIGDGHKDPAHQTEVRPTNTCVLVFLLVAVFAVEWPIVNVQTMYPLLIQYFWGWGTMETAIIFALLCIPAVLVQGVLVPKLAPKYGERWMTAAGMMLMGVGGAYALCRSGSESGSGLGFGSELGSRLGLANQIQGFGSELGSRLGLANQIRGFGSELGSRLGLANQI